MTQDILAADTAMGAVTLKVANLDRMIGYYQQGVGLSLLAAGRRQRHPRASGQAVADPRAGARTQARVRRTPPGCSTRRSCSTPRPTWPHPSTRSPRSSRTPSPAAPTTWSARPSTSTTRRATASSCTGTATRARGPGTARPSRWPRSTSTRTGSCSRTSPRPAPPTPAQRDRCRARAPEGRRHPDGEAVLRRHGRFRDHHRYGTQALFVSAGGYHHHLGMNTWQSSGRRNPHPRARARRGVDPGADDG